MRQSLRNTLIKLVTIGMLSGWAQADILYSVRPGDSIESIAKAYGLQTEEILAANPKLGDLAAGQVLVLPEKSPERVQASAPEDPQLVSGVDYDPPQATKVSMLDEKEQAAAHRRRSLSARRGRMVRGITSTATRFIGVPYRMGGTTSRAFDCSGFTQAVYRINGITLPRTADVQYNVGKRVPSGKEAPGDLVFFETYLPGASHCGIYLGNGKFIHASSSRGVTISSLSETYYRNRYLGAKRVF